MHANVGGGSNRNEWRLPPDDTLQVGGEKNKKVEVGDEEDLDPLEEGHNWTSIICSLLVISIVITGIITAIYLLGYVDELLYWSGKRMKLEEYLGGDLYPERLAPTWISHTHLVFQADDGGLMVLDTTNNTVYQLVNNHTLRQLNVKAYHCSFDRRYVLFQHNVKKVFKHTFTALYTVIDVAKDHHTHIRLKDFPKVQPQRLQYVSWLGNTNSLVIVSNNDIFIRTSPIDDTDYRITYTGQPNLIYNGVPDWLYQEDIFSSSKAFWYSQDGTHIMYGTFNDSDVGVFSYPWLTTTSAFQTATSQVKQDFPGSKSVRYPTPGSINPQVQLWIVDATNVTDLVQWELKPPQSLEKQEFYITSADWVGQSNQQVAVVWMNRAQNLSIISICQASGNWTCEETHAERAVEDTWLDMQPHPIFAPDGNSFLLLASIQEGNTDYFTHIKHVTISPQRIAVLSHGRHEVVKILEWDSYNHLVYYLGSESEKAGQQHMYIVRDPTTDDPKRFEPECITCELSNVLWRSRLYYGNCTYFNALVNPSLSFNDEINEVAGSTHYMLECEGPGLPLAGLHLLTTHRLVRILYDTRQVYIEKLKVLALPTHKTIEVPLPHGCKAQVQLLLPPSWRPELRDAAYPVVVEVDGRPGSTSVNEKFKVDWGMYMSSKNDVVYVKLDVRGSKISGGKTALYRKLGGVEVQDQITVLKYLLSEYQYLDETRIGIWGWGYGGYVTSMVLGSQQQVFRCGIAISPITDWLYYNSVFTERILGLPVANYKAYVEADATQRAKHIPSHSFYLMHGMADLSTPFTHSLALAKALADAGVMFKYHSYVDEGHELSGVLEHVYSSMEDYLQECLNMDTDEQLEASSIETTT